MANQMVSLSPNLMVKDVSKTLEFYIDILGFVKVVTAPPEGEPIWGMVQSGPVTFMFQEINSIKEEYPQLASFEPGGGLTFYIHVDNLIELFENIKGKVTVIKEIHKQFYGATEFSIKDCNGYILTFSQDIE